MSADDPAINPFADEQTAPLASRPRLIVQLRQHLSDPIVAGGALLLGRQWVGKTSQLIQFRREFYDISLGVMLTLDETICQDEETLLRYIAERSTELIIEQGYATTDTDLLSDPLVQVDDAPDNDTDEPDQATPDARQWLAETVLPACFRYIRNQRRLVWLIDDAHYLIDAIEDGQLSADLPTFLHGLLGQQLAIIMAADLNYEDRIATLSPLIQAENVHQLHSLDQAVVGTFYRALPQTLFADKTIDEIYRVTGGEPFLVDHLARRLYAIKADEMQNLTDAHIKQVTGAIYQDAEPFFRALWGQLSQAQQLVLTALSNRQYATPIETVTTARIATWLAEIDLPLDDTSINAALRGLAYMDFIDREQATIRVKSRLMQRWLLENAYIAPSKRSVTDEIQVANRVWMWVLAGLLGLVLLIGVAASVTQQNGTDDISSVPTVTLVPNTSP